MARLKLVLLLCSVYSVYLVHGEIKPTPTKAPITCPNAMWKCEKSNRCIPNSWKCDGDVDCDEGEDEEESLCSKNKRCGDHEYECQGSFRGYQGYIFHLTMNASMLNPYCIPESWKCDGEFDCANKDDEADCDEGKNVKCGLGQFKCNSAQGHYASCIPESWKCDGQNDCADGADENDCHMAHHKCEENTEFQCADGSCIYKTWKCDGDEDCLDGSDEKDCPTEACDPTKKFKCANMNFCIPKSWQCDGEPDCIDRSDEKDCEKFHPNRTITCNSNEFQCKSGAECISQDWKCDGDIDCGDGSDESAETCPQLKGECPKDHTRCKSGECIPNQDWCNGERDCFDGSDEKQASDGKPCARPIVQPPKECDNITEFQCPSGKRCIPFDKLCSSETSDCENICKDDIVRCNKESANCVIRESYTKKHVYHCAPGFQPSGSDFKNAKCEDINECKIDGICDQKCINLPGSFMCQCYPGFKLTYPKQNDTTRVAKVETKPTKCRAMGEDPLLLLSNRAAIRQYDLSNNRYLPIVKELDSAVAMDYWLKNTTIIWSDVAKEQIIMCNMSKNPLYERMTDCDDNDRQILVKENISTPDGLAVDWIHGLLFWTDTGLDTISVMDLNTRKRKTLFSNNDSDKNSTKLDEPRAIAVDPVRGLIFWTDWGSPARIERASMDGKDRITIFQGEDIKWPNGLALDIFDQKVYWADAKTKSISTCDYDGKNMKVVHTSHAHIKHPFSLAVFEEKLYWTDWDQEGVLSMNKFHGTGIQKITHGVSGPMTVRILHNAVQPEHPNKCDKHRCNDGALCLPRGHYLNNDGKFTPLDGGLSYSCTCAMGYKLGEDPAMCVLEQALSEVIEEGGNKFSLAFLLFILIVAFFGIVGYVYTRNRPSHFSALHFDNPIYRRTVEELDPDMEAGPDTSLGPISAVGTSTPSASRAAEPKLVLGQPGIDFRDPTQYAYDQPPPSYEQANGSGSNTAHA